MIRKIFAASVATVAIAFAGPALAGPARAGGGSAGANAEMNPGASARMNAGAMGGPSHAGINARVNSQGLANASATGSSHASRNSVLSSGTTTIPRAPNSQGLQHASTTAIANANSASVLARGAVPSTSLPGLTTGLTVQNSSGTDIGTVSQVVTDSSGNVRLVVVTSSTGQTYRLAPSTLSISGSTVTTTTTNL